MSDHLDDELLASDLDRIIMLASVTHLRIHCNLHEREKCLMSTVGHLAGSKPSPTHRDPFHEYTVIERDELEELRKALAEFRRRFKERYGR